MGCTTRCNTSILVDDILFDIGMGTVKQIERLKIYTKSINYLVLSHFHADHFLDIPNLLIGRGIRKETENKFTIIGPIGTREFYRGQNVLVRATEVYNNPVEKQVDKEKEIDDWYIRQRGGR